MNLKTWKADIAKIIISVSCFLKCSIIDICQGSEFASGSKYPRDLNNQDSEYISGSECVRVLDIPGFWICHG